MKRSFLLFAAAAAAGALLFSGCQKDTRPDRSFTWEPAHYTIDEMLDKAYDSPEAVKRYTKERNPDYCYDDSEKSVEMYNLILGYLDNVLKVDYKIDFLVCSEHLYPTAENPFYTVNIILDGYDENSSLPMLYNGDSKELESSVELFLTFENRWKDLNNDIDKVSSGTTADYIDHHRSGAYNGVFYRPEYITTHDWQAFYKDSPQAEFRDVVFFMPEGSTEEDGKALYEDKEFRKIVKKYRLKYYTIADSTGGNVWKLEYK